MIQTNRVIWRAQAIKRNRKLKKKNSINNCLRFQYISSLFMPFYDIITFCKKLKVQDLHLLIIFLNFIKRNSEVVLNFVSCTVGERSLNFSDLLL